jgi:hypothetical protein
MTTHAVRNCLFVTDDKLLLQLHLGFLISPLSNYLSSIIQLTNISSFVLASQILCFFRETYSHLAHFLRRISLNQVVEARQILSFEVVTGVYLRILFFCAMRRHQWVIKSRLLRLRNLLTFKGRFVLASEDTKLPQSSGSDDTLTQLYFLEEDNPFFLA